jgi:hypothetical protein
MSKNTLKIFKIFFRTRRPKSIKHGTNYLWVKGIRVCFFLIKGQVLFKGKIIAKIGWGLLRIFFSRTTGPSLTRLGTYHPWGKWIQVCSNETDCPSPRGGNSKRVKIH